MEGSAYDGTDETVRLGTAVVDEGLEFIVVDEAVGEDGIIGLLGNDFTDEDARFVVIAQAFTLKGYGKLFNDRGIDVAARMDVAAGPFDLIDVMSRFNAEVIGQNQRVFCRKGNRKGTGLFNVVCRLVLVQKQSDFIEIGMGTPSSIHGIRNSLFIIRADDKYPFRRDAGIFSCKFFTHDFILLTVLFFIIAKIRKRWIQDVTKKSNPAAAAEIRGSRVYAR